MRIVGFVALFGAAAAAGCRTVPAGEVDAEGALEYRREGDEAYAAGRYESAVALYTRSIQLNPQAAEAWWRRGNAYAGMAERPEGSVRPRELLERAAADYAQAVRANPALYDAYFNRAMIDLYFARYREAARDLIHCSQLNERDPEPHMILGWLYEEVFENRLAQAIEHYEKYVQLGGTDETVREKVRAWREFRKSMEPEVEAKPEPALKGSEAHPSGPARTPNPEEEKAAEEMHAKVTSLIGLGRREDAMKALEELLSNYGHTRYVKDRLQQFEVLRRAFKPAEEKPQ